MKQIVRSPLPRRIGRVNWIGLRTLCLKEAQRFLKVWMQTIAAPVVTTLLFLAVFSLALGGSVQVVQGVSFAQFLAPGLIMMAMMQNAFANTSSSMMISKIQGNIIDVLMPPMSPAELTLGYAFGGLARGVVVGLVVTAAIAVFVPLHAAALPIILFYGVMASLMMALIGVVGAIWAEKFDHIAAVTNFIVTPMSFLSGTFYSIERLPEGFHAVALANPFFHLIDGFRYGFTGHADGPLAVGAAAVTVVNLALLLLVHSLFRRGYKLKA